LHSPLARRLRPTLAAVEVEALMFRGHPEVVDADLADYFGSIPHAELLKSVARRIARGLMLNFSVELGAEKHDGRRNPQPDHYATRRSMIHRSRCNWQSWQDTRRTGTTRRSTSSQRRGSLRTPTTSARRGDRGRNGKGRRDRSARRSAAPASGRFG
jgi:hypothetical protein